ncbi:MAG: GTPase [Clostridia bacterium]|nr:GTPase [Clostridia bacterium]
MKKNLPPETPVYMFLGFLESGKTKFIQETFEDPRFMIDEKTLLLVTEEGIEEYNKARFADQNVEIAYIDSEDDLTEDNLLSLQQETGAVRVVVEYNGMWTLQKFFEAMPEGWMINQVMTFFDSNTFLNYNANMRQLVFDKMQNTQLIVFNRFSDSVDKMELHKIVRGVSRRADIVYERGSGEADFDDIEDPLPFDINADVIEIADRDYAFFYRDLTENLEAYLGKTVRFKGLVAVDSRLPENNVVIGRHVMTCCEADIEYLGVACVMPEGAGAQMRDWYEVTAKIELKKHYVYKGKGPVLTATDAKKANPPEEQLATFY